MEVPCKESRLCESSSCGESRLNQKNRQGKIFSFRDLIDALYDAFATDNVDIDRVQDLMASYISNPADWKKYAKFDRYRYTRNLVDEGNGKFNLMVLCWGEGHESPVHDHSDAHCVMKILQGELCETRYAWPEGQETSNTVDGRTAQGLKELQKYKLGLNEICYINDSLGLHRVENPSSVNPAVSLHLYSPPFSTCSIFNEQTGRRTVSTVTFWSRYGEKRNREIQDSRCSTNN